MRGGLVLPVVLGAALLLASALPAAAAGTGAEANRGTTRSASAPATTIGAPIWAFNSGQVLTVAQKAGRGAKVRVEPNAGRNGQRWVFGAHGTIRPAENQQLCLNVPRYRVRHAFAAMELRRQAQRAIRQEVSVTAHCDLFHASWRGIRLLPYGAAYQ
ncbi:MAG TPA: ricin-type beta-trefoil lectin domain protein [Streptosporangiaceae bacterium]